jgi:predicted house-cleaning noncanonical NTP pyrophosphatase (MazG superfamily)
VAIERIENRDSVRRIRDEIKPEQRDVNERMLEMSNPDIGRGMASALRAENNMLRRKLENSITEITTDNIMEELGSEEKIDEIDNRFEFTKQISFGEMEKYTLFMMNVRGDRRVYIKTGNKKVNVISVDYVGEDNIVGEKFKFSNKIKVFEVEEK